MKALMILAFVWFSGQAPVSYNLSRNAEPVAQVALDMLKSDLTAVTDRTPVQAQQSAATLRIVQYDRDRVNLRSLGVPARIADSLGFVKEAFYIGTKGRQVVIVGSDARGTAYGELELSRLAGVSPLVWWGDARPEKRSSLELPDGYSTFQHPSVEYRGLFLNDEDWAFRPWATQTFDPTGSLTITAKTYKEIFKLLLRFRANTMWPGMHPDTTPFFQVPGAKEAADSCGILIGTSHCEPLLRNNVGEWNVAKRGRYNYITNKQAVLDYWTERLLEVKGSEELFTIGMRGIHDGSMEGVRTLEEKTVALQQVIDDQRELIRKYLDKDVTRVPQMFMPYKEVLEIMENGLRVPDDVTIVWCDDNYGYMTRLSDEAQQKRSGGAGVYYHLSYCGRPHDHLWLSTVQPGLIYNEMRQAYDHNVRRVWVANVHDPKVALYNLEFFLDMAWDIDSFRPESIDGHMHGWLAREFGDRAADLLSGPMTEYYRLCSIRKPEFFGWSQVELENRQLYPTGLSPVSNTQFSFTEFGNEAQRYIDQFRVVRSRVESVAAMIPERSRDCYFAQVLYPVCAAESHAEALLYAQKARSRAKTTYSPGNWKTDPEMMTACALSLKAYQDVRSLTAKYNEELAGGKWRGIMSAMPRDLNVFWAPLLPVSLTDAEIERWSAPGEAWKASSISKSGEGYLACDAEAFSSSTVKVHPVRSLGHSCNAVPVPKGESLSYSFTSDRSGRAVIRVAVLPTQANDRGDIRFSVSLDGTEAGVFSIKEPYRSDRWKENVMRNQRLVDVPVEISSGKHTLTLKAVDDHIIFDQWMLDFNPRRQFYIIPR